jgi:hypothetical protein
MLIQFWFYLVSDKYTAQYQYAPIFEIYITIGTLINNVGWVKARKPKMLATCVGW